MFKENKQFWLYIIGSILLMILVMFGLQSQVGRVTFDDFRFVPGTSATLTPRPSSPGLEPGRDYEAVIRTNRGDFTVDLFETAAPNTVNSFVYLAAQDYYDGTSFHRLVPGVLLQGGSDTSKDADPSNDSLGGPGYVIGDEINWDALDFDQELRSKLEQEGYTSTPRVPSKRIAKYRLAMASVGPNTSGSQFFIVLGDRENEQLAALTGRHTVFAEVTQNTQLIDELGSVAVDNPLSQSPRPLEVLTINDIEIRYKD
ncbi:MAG: Peptidyl-prolyl cis-trans isomerase B [candidate division WS6 bacterium OLB20]|uniref:peptidylprolyl isomerase n=1 Tax=candidate division WS6 bacterium OLB20 TaxID=1617426 RepID=A0A136LYE7_9BACT|nr:MAG: Peptidyl-prolyl cis-trans isomerase B [candidate division WS6 bacterium OLB20]